MGKIFIEKRRRFSSSISVSTTTRMMIEGMENLTTSDIHQQMSHIFDVATGVGLPCTVQNCGDMIYRSTLDPELRRELKPLFTAQGAALLSTLFIFLSITPGALPGYVEYYVVQPIQDRMRKKYSLEDFTLGTKLGQGGFVGLIALLVIIYVFSKRGS